MSVRKLALGFVAAGLACSLFLSGVLAGHYDPEWFGLAAGQTAKLGLKDTLSTAITATDSTPDPAAEKYLGLFWEVYNLAKAKHVDRPGDPQKLMFGAINGMLQYGFNDQFSTFLPPAINTLATQDLQGNFGGVGLELEKRNGELMVVAPLNGTPGDLAGILAGDVIKKVDGASVQELTVTDAVAKIRGDVGSKVTLSIQRIKDDGTLDTFDKTLTRAVINVKSVELADKGNGIFDLSIHSFTADTIAEWDAVVKDLVSKKPKGVILDLRNNPGGYVDAAEHVINDLVRSGISITQDFGADNKQVSTVDGKGKLLDVPMLVLTNGGTASAAEMVTGALQDHKRAKVYGEQTFGKGVIQEIFSINVPGSTAPGSVRVVTDKWYTPSGTWIQDIGIKPDTVIKLTQAAYDAKQDQVMDQAMKDIVK